MSGGRDSLRAEITAMQNNILPSNFDKLIWLMILLLPLAAWLGMEGNPLVYWQYEVPDGQLVYVFSKLFGLYALLFLWLQTAWALLKDTDWAGCFPAWRAGIHQLLGLSVAAVIVCHATFFVAGVSLRQQAIAWNLLLPVFDHGYYRFMLSLGIVALGLLPVVIAAGFALRRNKRQWKLLHWLAPLMFALAFVHGLFIGSETRFGIMSLLYVGMGASLGVFLFKRIAWCAR